jgi:ribokinase
VTIEGAHRVAIPANDESPSVRVTIADELRPIVVVGAHSQSLFMHVADIPREGETVAAHGYAETLDGGKATNQAAAAARVGAPVRFVSLVGNDVRGRRILDYLDTQGIDRRWVKIADAPTDVGFVMLSPRGIPAIASSQDLSKRLDAVFVEASEVAIRGASIVVCQLEAPPACAREAFQFARANRILTLLNPAPMVPLPEGLLELADVLVPNQHEAAVLVGREAPVAELTERLADAAPWACIVVTAGADGAYLGRAGRRSEHVSAPTVRAVDTTGAGDAFVGALAARLRDGCDIEPAVAFAVKAAALSVTRPGTLDAFATLDEIMASLSAQPI